jgi:hypothetical protein
MNSIKFVLSVSLFFLLIIACNTSSRVNEIRKERETSTSSKDQIKATVTGKGDKVERITLNKGVAIFDIDYTGQHNFYVRLTDGNGQYVKGLVNTIGSYSGQVTATVDKDGPYMLEIQSQGKWTISTK